MKNGKKKINKKNSKQRGIKMANIYSKFNCDCNGKSDCRAYYLKENGTWQRIGGNEFNNVEKFLDEVDVEFARALSGIDFSSLKTEIETMQDVHLPDHVVISEFESFKVQNQFVGYAKVSNIKASQLVPKTEFSKFDILNLDGTQKKWKEFLEFSQKSGGYFLKIVVDSEADFKLFYNYFISTYQVLTVLEYDNFQ